MAFPQSTHATVDPQHPDAFAYCDRCGFRYNISELVFQFDWRGSTLANLRILVCKRTCLDVPQEQWRTIIIGPDPVPIPDSRPGFQPTQEGPTPVFSVLEIVDGDLIPPSPPTGLYNDGGVLTLTLGASVGWPSEDPAIPGALWSNGGVVTASLPTTPVTDPMMVTYGQLTAAQLLNQGADVFPTTSWPAGSGGMWVNSAMGGEVWVA